MDISTITNLLLFTLLIVLTMLFVGSEFAFVKARMSRIHSLVEMGDKRAERVEKMINNLDYYLSACQLGITVTALGLGWIGESTFEVILHPLFDLVGVPDAMQTVTTVAAAFIIVTFIHVVVGELAPKTVAIQYAEKMAMGLSGPLYFFGVVLKPFIWTMNGAARGLVRLVGIKEMPTEQAHSEEELKVIMTESYQSGEINQTELSYMQNIFSFDERTAKDVMVPRTQMITLEEPVTVDQVVETIKEYNYTRYPVTESNGDKDNIIGFINVREYLTNHVSDEHVAAGDYIHDLPVITESSRISDALVKMQRESVHIALIIDEYGGTAGMITMEDILEEIVGEIRDEFDEDEELDVIKVDDNLYHINGRVLLDDLEDDFKIAFEESEDIDTIGGWMQSINTDIEEGGYIDTAEDRWQVLEVENHSIKQVAFLRDYNVVSADEESEEAVEQEDEK
ncbi:hemolysin family protein [Jeotgalicoccus halotolerans]|uniref:HlyC/CorC family transporter n=1 Tax=Jeotgalicoccus nanhaiensis TaxID=568603 RepID=A0ABR9XZA7_9STAP|nr:hemolysin family protein [Jeotgalicoccus nanhaiensis]MBF0754188.1 HlyC/CorC family transporter [Jeotgalicoccus nanhaiensis]TFU61372.1 HlyC/CorC family transporter [Jeotgalicoccus nanhaiensis]